ncbi:SIA4B sialyltransferase, partial [Calcarius ornatus]|nr:SIA4B sialyltransferase [Calcarius ornatus]
PSLLHTPTAHCTTSTNSSAWFNTRYKAAIGPLLTGAHHKLSSDVVQWWLVSEAMGRSLVPSDIQLQAIIQQLFSVFWALTVDAWDPSHFRTCAVVGNSGQLKESSHGLLIDAHDWVLRMNGAKITGFELDVGMRTTHLFIAVNLRPDAHLVLIPFKPLDHQWLHCVGLTVLFQHGEHCITPFPTPVLILSPAFLKYIHDNWTEHHGMPKCPHGDWLACAQVSVFGFGADSEGNWHHYWEKTHWSGAFRRMRAHDTDVEFSLIERQVHEGRIVFYN